MESILSSTNQSQCVEDTPSNANLNTQSLGGMKLSDIPHFTPTAKQVSTPDPSFSAPSSYDDGKVVYEYEFSFRFPDGTPAFVNLWDSNDLSACQRASASHVSEVVYSKETGNGFFTVGEATWCFKKEVFQRTYGPHNEVSIGDAPEPVRKPKQSADDILAAL